MHDDPIASQLEKILTARITARRLTLPVSTTASAEVSRRLADPSSSPASVAGAIEADALFALSVLLAARRSLGEAPSGATIENALASLGVVKMRSMLKELCAVRMATSRDLAIRNATEALLAHACRASSLAEKIAQTVETDAPSAKLGALIAHAGEIVVAVFLLEMERLATMRGVPPLALANWSKLVNELGPPIGRALAEHALPRDAGGILCDVDDVWIARAASPPWDEAIKTCAIGLLADRLADDASPFDSTAPALEALRAIVGIDAIVLDDVRGLPLEHAERAA